MSWSRRSVDNPASSRLGLTAPRSNIASMLLIAPWLRFCCWSRMNHVELRARIRQLIAPGELPSAPPLSDGSLSGQAAKIRRVVTGRSLPDPCLICGEADPTVSYAYANHTVIRSTLPAMHSGARIAKRLPDGADRAVRLTGLAIMFGHRESATS